MRTRLKDIAERLDLSPGLVSGVLNGRQNVWASEDTRRKIFEAASRLNYEYSAPSKQKPPPLTGSLELVYCRSPLPHRTEMTLVVEALTRESERLGLPLAIRSFENWSVVLDYYSGQANLLADLVLIWADGSNISNIVDSISLLGAPCLVYGEIDGHRSGPPRFSSSAEDIVIGAVDHMRVLGHRRIAFLGESNNSSTSRMMREAFTAKFKQCFGQTPLPQMICEPDLHFADYRECIRSLLALPEAEQPTGYFIGAGNLAWTVLEHSLRDAGFFLGFEKENRAAAGFFNGPFHLTYGDALGYDVTEIGSQLTLAIRAFMSKNDEAPNAQLRHYVPRLTRIPSLHLGNLMSPTMIP